MLFVLERRRSRRAPPRDPRRASLASEAIKTGSRAAVLSQAGAPLPWTIERADMLFVCEGVRKAAASERQPQRAERAMYTERGDMLSSSSDDEVGGLKARSALSELGERGSNQNRSELGERGNQPGTGYSPAFLPSQASAGPTVSR
jgi:hypothetical protein